MTRQHEIRPRDDQLVLIGTMGVGKSTIGRLLASRLGWDFWDNDAALYELTGKTAAEVERAEGQESLHRLEEQLLRDALGTRSSTVFAAAASVALDPEITAGARTIWLRSGASRAVENVLHSHEHHRPLPAEPGVVLGRLDLERAPLYAAMADITVDVANGAVATCDRLTQALASTKPLERARSSRPRYESESTIVDGIAAWRLRDDYEDVEAIWAPGAGMLGVSLRCRGEEMLWSGAGVAAYAHRRQFMGIPLLHPWANRLAEFAYRAGGHHVTLDRSSPLLLLDANGLPIHGVLTASRAWRVTETRIDETGAWLTAALDFDAPELLATFPFPHRLEITVVVLDGALRVRTGLTATGPEAVPMCFGFHPYLRIPGLPRADWEVSLPVHRRLHLDSKLIPTGVTEQVAPIAGAVGERTWDDAFDQVQPGTAFTVSGNGRSITVEYTDGYPVAQIFAPPAEEYLCIEPMTAPANALAGSDEALVWVPPGQSRAATFRFLTHIG